MLSSLHIENVALIKELDLVLGSGFTVLTGETGAGKSIIIDALSLLCGGRSDREIIRSGESYALVEGFFDCFDEGTLEALREIDVEPDEDGFVFLSRKVSADGRSVAKIGTRQVPSSRLRTVAEVLVGIHGQQDTLLLADRERHLPILDKYAKNSALIEEYRGIYQSYVSVQKELKALKTAEADRNERLEMLEFKLSELKKAKLTAGEEAELTALRLKLMNAEKIADSSRSAYSVLYGESGSVSEKLYSAINALRPIVDAVPEAGELMERLDAIKCESDDIADSVRGLYDVEEDVSTALDRTESRLDLINTLKRRHKTDFDGLLKEKECLEEEIATLGNSTERIEELERKSEKLYASLMGAAAWLTKSRKAAAVRLKEEIAEKLYELDMPSVRFETSFNEVSAFEDGADEIEFLISANAGEEPKSLSKIASGGELSRIMLAIKTVFASVDNIGTLVFDEIDTGISGKTSQKVGIMLKGLSKRPLSQVLCVTHSAQIASLADTHILASKREDGGRTQSSVKALDFDGRVEETARIIAGINVGEAARTAAKAMLAEGEVL